MQPFRMDAQAAKVVDGAGHSYDNIIYFGSSDKTKFLLCVDVAVRNAAGTANGTGDVEVTLFDASGQAKGSLIEETLTGVHGATFWAPHPILLNNNDYVSCNLINGTATDMVYFKASWRVGED